MGKPAETVQFICELRDVFLLLQRDHHAQMGKVIEIVWLPLAADLFFCELADTHEQKHVVHAFGNVVGACIQYGAGIEGAGHGNLVVMQVLFIFLRRYAALHQGSKEVFLQNRQGLAIIVFQHLLILPFTDFFIQRIFNAGKYLLQLNGINRLEQIFFRIERNSFLCILKLIKT